MAPPFLELGTIGTHDLDQYDHHLFNYLEPQSSFSSTTSSLSSPIFLSPPHQVQPPISDHRYYREPQNFQFQLLEADHHIVSYGGSLCDHDQGRGNESVVNFSVDDHSKSGAKDQQRIHENRSTTSHDENVSVKWMSSKMRIMKKMNSPDHTATAARVNNFEFEEQQIKVHPSSSPPPPSGITESSNNAAPIRVCSDCNTTKTPLWRSGPRGPKSLCNACGIRQRKARRAMAAAAAAAAAANGGTAESVAAPSVIKTSTTKVKIKDNKTIPFKKRCHKLTSTTTSPSPRAKSSSSSSSKTTTKLHFEDFSISTMNQNNSGTPPPPPSAATTAFQRAFPQDEKEAAILLMALSCGLVQG